MSWEDFITHIMTTTSKVEKVAIYDGQGVPVATTEDIETNESEGYALLKCLTDGAKSMTRICVDNTVFMCLQGIDPTFVGIGVDNHSRVIVARIEGDRVIAMIGHAEERGSFISELSRALHLKAEGQLITQQQLQQSQQLIPVDIEQGASALGPATSTEQILVEI